MPAAVKITAEDRVKVERMAAIGMRDEDIAQVLGIGEATVQRRLRAELARGRAKASMAVMGTAYQLATSGRCPAATFFWLKCRAKWREVDRGIAPAEAPKGLAIDE